MLLCYTQASIVNSRKHLLQRTTELKKLAMAGASSDNELGRLQTRVNRMQQDVSRGTGELPGHFVFGFLNL